MPAGALDTIRANSAAFSRRDVDAMLEFFTPDAVVLDRRPIGWGEFRGHAALRSYYQGLFDNVESMHEELEVVADEGETVVAACRLSVRLAGQTGADQVAFDYALRIGMSGRLIASIEIYDDVAAARAGASPGS
jgi:ketosteroid isomerase-like protein